MRASAVKILIVDDSRLVAAMLRRTLEEESDIEVMGIASTGAQARELIQTLRPDVVVLDVVLPDMSGLQLLQEYMSSHPIPTVVLSAHGQRQSQTTLDAFALGALTVLEKPTPNGEEASAVTRRLIAAIREASVARVTKTRATTAAIGERAPQERVVSQSDRVKWGNRLLAIGISTGGVTALERMMPLFPDVVPPILILAHMPKGFTKGLAEQLSRLTPNPVIEAQDGVPIEVGKMYLAPAGEHHMVIRNRPDGLQVQLRSGERVSGHRPSVDVLFESLAPLPPLGWRVASALLTGMGDDGAKGMKRLREAGGRTIAQDERSSVVFGMPRAAIALGAAEGALPLDEIPDWLIGALARKRA